MIIAFILFCVGLFILVKGASLMVDGSSGLALRFKISPIVIGLTIVAFGTSAPELVVSMTGAFSGNTDLILGSIIGSCTANILLILGTAAAISPLAVKKNTVYKEVPMFFLAASVLSILGLQEVIDSGQQLPLIFGLNERVGVVSFSDGLILLSFFVIFLYYTFGLLKVSAPEPEDIEEKRHMSLPKDVVWIILGLVGLAYGSKLVVDNAAILARAIGVSDVFIGLTLVALGTSLPELAATAVAAFKKQTDLAVGNVVGSNIFNIFLILGLTSLITPLPLNGSIIFDILVMLIGTIALFIILFMFARHKIGRVEGVLMVIVYLAYITFDYLRDLGIISL